MKTAITCSVLALLIASTATALPLADMPERVGGYVLDDQGQPISGATVTFANETTSTFYQGTTDATGWYGNVGFSSVPDASVKPLLSQNYPNPFTSSTTVEIQSQSLEKNFGSEPQDIQIFDLRGRLVGSVPVTNGTHDIQTRRNASLPKGAYFYKLGDEVRKMVGSPKRITVIVSGGTASEKVLVQYRRVVEADGYVLQDELVDLDESQINFASVNLIPAFEDIALAIKVFNISGSECLLDGSVTVTGTGFNQTESAGSDSLFSFTIPASVDSVEFFASGFAGYDHPDQVFSVLRSDSVAVRGWLGDEESVTAVGDLDELVYLELVPEVRLDDPYFLESISGPNNEGVNHNREDKRFVLCLNTVESGFAQPANEVSLNKLRAERQTYFEILDGGLVDGVVLIGYTSEETTDAPIMTVEELLNRHDLYVDNSVGPNNFRGNLDADPDIDYSSSSINDSSSQGNAREEIANPTVLYDNPNKVVQNLYDDIYYRDIVHTVMKSRIGRNLNSVTPRTSLPLEIKAFNISGSECLLDGSITVSGGGYSSTQQAGGDSLFTFSIPAYVTNVQFSVSGFVGYDHADQKFSVLHPDSVAVRGWLCDEESVAQVGDLPSVVYLELVPEERLDDPYFLESVSGPNNEGVNHRREDVRFLLYTNTYDSQFTVPANEVTLNKLRTAVSNYLSICDGGSGDGVPLLGYSLTEITSPDGSDPMGRWDVWVDNNVGPGNFAQDRDGDGDIDYAGSNINDYSSQGNAYNEIAGPVVLYDNASSGTINGIGELDEFGNIVFSAKGVDMIHTVMKHRIALYE